ncbi:hypothetical protein [Kiloniella antarctica]|uniref:4Fe4S-binding SPASM domain-containing protein n=1 Tax=Kiloniella antarctica TaxID=1550907 RepID=A0ABW5BQV3_9PROT
MSEFNRERIFTYSETWGPFSCEAPNCKIMAWSVVVSQGELDQLEQAYKGDRWEMHRAALKGEGKAFCGDCRSNFIEKQQGGAG